MRNLSLILLLITTQGCAVYFQADSELTEMANQEWRRSGPCEELKYSIPVVGHYCIGTPCFWLDTEARVLRVFMPPCMGEELTRIFLRYELSKAAWAMNAFMLFNEDSNECLVWCTVQLVALDSMLHLPPSELHSLYRVLFPGDLDES